MFYFRKSKIKIWQIFIGILLAGVMAAWFGEQAAQAVSPWSEPVLLNDQDAATPFLIADDSGALHAFWGSPGANGEMGAIFYRRLSDGEWSETVDILAPPSGDAALYPSAVIDASGTIHLVWVSDKLYYSRTHLSQALNPRNWSKPYQMTNYGVTNAAIQLGLDGSLNVLFGSRGSSPAVFLLKSDDGGDFWRIAVQVSAPAAGAYALTCSLAVDASGRLHAAWAEALQAAALTEGMSSVPPSGIYYARSDDGGAHWSYPRAIAGSEQGEPAIGVDGRDVVHIFWSGTGSAAGKYHTYLEAGSGDWHATERILIGGEGLLGAPALAVDSSGRMHAALALASQTLFAQASPGEIVTLSWWNGKWGDRYQASLPLMKAQVEHSHPAIAVSGGSTLHLVWIATEQRDAQQGATPGYLWYTTRRLGSDPLELHPIATLAAPIATATTEIEATLPPLTPTPWEVVESGFLPHETFWYKQAPLIFGAALTLIVLIVIINASLRKRKNAR